MKRDKWKQEGLNAEERLSELRRKDKASLLYGNGFSESNAIPKAGIPSFTMRNGSSGIVLYDDRKTLCLPSPAALACSWNKELAKEMGQVLAEEAIDTGTDVVLAPSLNIKRNPLCGENFEYYSEDPLLSGKMAGAVVSGIQSRGVGACLKHFVCSNQQTSRFHMDAQVDARALKEIYLRSYEIAIKESDPWMVMTSFNKINGLDIVDNGFLLNTVLRKEMKFRGVVVSGWSAVTDPIKNHNTGIDLEMPCYASRSKDISNAVKRGVISRKAFEESTKRISTLALKTKSRPNTSSMPEEERYDTIQQIAEESIVLAKNTKGVLPLSSYKDTCVIGALAEEYQIAGRGSSRVNPKTEVSLLDEMFRYAANSHTGLAYAPGYSLGDELPQSESDRLIIDAEELASKHKNVIYVVGTEPGNESDQYDRQSMRLSASQIRAFKHIYEHNKNIILVVVSGTPVELPMADDVKAIVISYFGGEMSAKALHRVLIGRVNPSGHLAETWPISYSSVPSSCFYPIYKVSAPYKESIYVGYRYYCSAAIPTRFPFGHGLSYSRVIYKDLRVNRESLSEGEKLEVSLKLYNMSRRPTNEVVQFYIAPRGGNVWKASRELKDFVKVSLTEGETKAVKSTLSYKDFAHYDIASKKWLVEAGTYDILVGKSVDEYEIAGSVVVESKSSFKQYRDMLPSYYYFINKSLFIPGDYEFEHLLEHRIKNRSLDSRDEFTFESTIKNLSKTRLGKEIVSLLKNNIDPSLSKADQKAKLDNELEAPYRILNNYGVSERRLLSRLDLANGKIFSALIHRVRGRRK